MKTSIVGIRVDAETSILIERVIKHKLAANKADAIRYIMQYGIKASAAIVDRKEAAEKILHTWRRKGFPKLPKNLSEILLKERD